MRVTVGPSFFNQIMSGYHFACGDLASKLGRRFTGLLGALARDSRIVGAKGFVHSRRYRGDT